MCSVLLYIYGCASKKKARRQAGSQTDRSLQRWPGNPALSLPADRASSSATAPPPLPSLCPGCALGDPTTSQRHTHLHGRAPASGHTHTHTHTPSLLALCRSVSLTLTLLYAAILGSGAWNNPRVRMSVCVRVYVSPDFTLTHAHIHTHNTVRRTHLLSVWLQEWSSGSRNPLAEDSFQFYAQLFLVGFFSAAFPALPPRLLWISNNHPLAVCSGATSEARPESDLLSPGCLLSFSHGDAQPERRQGKSGEGKTKAYGSYSHTHHSDSGILCAMVDIYGIFSRHLSFCLAYKGKAMLGEYPGHALHCMQITQVA